MERYRKARVVTRSALESWLRGHGVDPKEPCKGSPAIAVLERKLLEDFGTTNARPNDRGDLCSLFTGETLVHRNDVRTYLWGEEVTITEWVQE
jgi:hypothetical protein